MNTGPHVQQAPGPELVDLGQMSYAQAYQEQVRRVTEVLAARDAGAPVAGVILFVEHTPPVITISRRPGVERHLLAESAALKALHVDVVGTDRGGDITYHGPGQLVVYPILDLNYHGLRLHAYMRLLEQAAIDTCAAFGVEACRDPNATGVWLPGEAREGDTREGGAKICALGVRVRRWVSMHGMALNVTTNLRHFDLIVPCGLTNRRVTSLREALGEACPSISRVRETLGANLVRLLGAAASSAKMSGEPGGATRA